MCVVTGADYNGEIIFFRPNKADKLSTGAIGVICQIDSTTVYTVNRQPLSARDLSTDRMYRYVILSQLVYRYTQIQYYTRHTTFCCFSTYTRALRVSDKTTAALFSVRVPIDRNEPSSDGDLACRLQSRSKARRTPDTVFDSAIFPVTPFLYRVPRPLHLPLPPHP